MNEWTDRMTARPVVVDPTIKAIHVGPTAQDERIGPLDVLRGFALLGILIVNVQLFAMPLAAYLNPTVWGDLTGSNYLAWLLIHLLADQKMMTIFSILFGAGIVLFSDRVTARGQSAVRLHYRRNFWLLLFGSAHGYLLWHGDILFLYAICAFVVFWFRTLAPRWLIALGLVFIAVSSAIYFYFGWSMQFWPPEMQAAIIEEIWQPSPEDLANEVAAYRGGWLAQMGHRVPATVEFQAFVLPVWGFWRAAGLMLIGMAFFKLGILSAKASATFYLSLIVLALVVGLPLVAYGVSWNFKHGWSAVSMFYGSQFNYWGSLVVSLGWIGAVLLICQRGELIGLTRRLAAVGQMALTNYLLQTLICGLVFYGYGLGLFGGVDRTGQVIIVIAIWILQLAASPVWLRNFRFGPAEWLWRVLTYWHYEPFRRRAAA